MWNASSGRIFSLCLRQPTPHCLTLAVLVDVDAVVSVAAAAAGDDGHGDGGGVPVSAHFG